MKYAITGGSGFIGTNLIEYLVELGCKDIINIDKSNPYNSEHDNFWIKANILDKEHMFNILNAFRPDVLIHLAARTDTLSKNIADYTENTTGTLNVIDAAQKVQSIGRVIITSTQYVYKCHNKPFPDSYNEYKPHTIYGVSKVQTEEYTRNANLDCSWTIVRPTNIWGPWHMRYPAELWRMIDKGMYVHPNKKSVIRTYGYVKNIVYQIVEILNAPLEAVDKKTFYLGDVPIDSYVWLNEVSLQLTKKNIKRLPVSVFKSLSIIGDSLRKINIPFMLYEERFRNMIEDYSAPTKLTVAEFGVKQSDLATNVEETINWIKGSGKKFFNYWNSKRA